MHPRYHRYMPVLPLLIACAATCMLTACSLPAGRSPEVRHYVLALPAQNVSVHGSREITGAHVAVGPVSLPGYLDRSQVFIRKNDATDIALSEFDRWGENLNDGITRLLAESLSARLAPSGGIALPLRAGNACDWRISVDIVRFDGAPGHDVILDAGWTLSTPAGKALREGHFVHKETAQPGMEGLVLAHGVLIDRLGEAVAAAIHDAETTRPVDGVKGR